jgi:hypothetical protein
MVETCRRTFRIILFAALSLLFSFTAFSADPATLSGTVMDQQGAAIPNGCVIVHWDSAGLDGVKENIGIRDDKIARTDSTGHFSVELPPGVYDVFVARILAPLREADPKGARDASLRSPIESQPDDNNNAGLVFSTECSTERRRPCRL